MQRLLVLVLPPLLLLLLKPPAARAVHYPDNGDGTYSNPVMPNAHWSDPSVVRVGNLYYCVTSSIETTPSMQILQSADLVNWDVVGSVSRLWVDRDPSTGQAIPPSACWSPRIMFLRGKFRVMWTQAMHHFLIAEAVDVRGPWTLVQHNLTNMSEYVFGASTFVDTTGDGKT
jgi:beta-xylosidase